MKKRTTVSLIVGDIIGFSLTFMLAYFAFAFRLKSYGPPLVEPTVFMWDIAGLYCFGALVGVLYFMQKGHYTPSAPWWQQVKHIVTFSVWSLLSFVFLFYVFKENPSRLLILSSWIGLIPILMMIRQIVRKILMIKGVWGIPTVIIGGYENAIETLYALKSESYLSYNVSQVVLPRGSDLQIAKFAEIHAGYLISKDTPEFSKGQLIVICPDTRRELELDPLTRSITEAEAEFAMIPPIDGFSYYGLQPSYFFGYNIVLLKQPRQLANLLNQIVKNGIDRFGALCGLLLLSPLFLFISLKVKQDGGPVFYGHKRLGRNGKTFKCWKFRSMVTNSQEVLEDLLANDPAAKEEWEREFKLKNDPRITKIGDVLRTTSLDEIPQLLNVLMGEMSLVGPRPIVEDEVKYYGDKIHYYYSVRPGVTGLWQVSGRNDISYDLRVYLDRWYVRHWSIWTDIVIIIKTVFVVALKKGAY